MSMIDDIRFWAQIIEDQQQIIFCSPENESRVKSHLAARGWDAFVEVIVTQACPDDKLILMPKAIADDPSLLWKGWNR